MTPPPSNPVQSTQPMTATHTPTPWMTQPCGELLPDDVMIVADMGKLPNGIQQISTVARVLSIRQTPEITAANAAFIVEAVNSHASLKARIQELEKHLGIMVTEFTHYHYQGCPRDESDSAECQCYAGTVTEQARAALHPKEPT